MKPNEKAAIIHYHRKRMGMPLVQTLGWRSTETQEQRFDALCKWGDLTNCSILDLGCGYGDLKEFLDANYYGIRYLGIDIIPEFIAAAKLNFPSQQHTTFLVQDFLNCALPVVDIIFASGSLNYRCENPQHPYAMIQKMWATASKGIAFNLLDASKHGVEEVLQAYDPFTVQKFCRNLDPKAELIRGYHPEDFTIVMHR